MRLVLVITAGTSGYRPAKNQGLKGGGSVVERAPGTFRPRPSEAQIGAVQPAGKESRTPAPGAGQRRQVWGFRLSLGQSPATTGSRGLHLSRRLQPVGPEPARDWCPRPAGARHPIPPLGIALPPRFPFSPP